MIFHKGESFFFLGIVLVFSGKQRAVRGLSWGGRFLMDDWIEATGIEFGRTLGWNTWLVLFSTGSALVAAAAVDDFRRTADAAFFRADRRSE